MNYIKQLENDKANMQAEIVETWTKELKQICFERQIRCMDTDYCSMEKPCATVLSIHSKRTGAK